MTPGTLISNRYEIIAPIGSGGMGAVFKVLDKKINRVMALKVLGTKFLTDKVTIERFKREAMAAASLSHPHLTGVYDWGLLPDGAPFLVMEFLSGESLEDIIVRNGNLSGDSVIRIMTQVAGALGYAHSQNIIHRDLKPSNIMLLNQSDEEFIKVVDFGLVNFITNEAQQAAKLTSTGEVLGSPYYMSPEQCKAQPLDGRTDMYSLGCMMYEMLTGSVPFLGESLVQIVYKHLEDKPAPFSSVCPELVINPELEAITLRCLEKDPALRFQTMEQLGQALRGIGKHDYFADTGSKDKKKAELVDSTRTRQMVAVESSSNKPGLRSSTGKDPVTAEQDKGASLTPQRAVFLAAGVAFVVSLAGLGLYMHSAGYYFEWPWPKLADSSKAVVQPTAENSKAPSISNQVEPSLPPQAIVATQPIAATQSIAATQPISATQSIAAAQQKKPLPNLPDSDESKSNSTGNSDDAQNEANEETGLPLTQRKTQLESSLVLTLRSGKFGDIFSNLADLSMVCENLSDYPAAESYAKQLFDLVNNHKEASVPQQRDATFLMARALMNTKHYDDVEGLTKQAISLSEKSASTRDVNYGKCLLLLGQFYQFRSRHADAADLYHKAANIFEQAHGMPKRAVQAYARSVFNYYKDKNWQHCISEGEAALKHAELLKVDTYYVGKILGELAESFNAIHDRDKALSYAKRAAEYWQSHKISFSDAEYRKTMNLISKIQSQ